MKKEIKYMFILLLVSYSTGLKSKSLSRADSVVIQGEITDSLVRMATDKEVNVVIRISTFPCVGYLEPADTYILKTQKPRTFKLKIAAPADRFYMQIDFHSLKQVTYWSSLIENVYILDKGDSVNCKLSNEYFSFTGRGSEKLNCQSEIYLQRYIYHRWELDWFNKNGYEAEFDYKDRKQDSILANRLDIVKRYSQKLGTELSAILTANCYGLRYYIDFRMLQVFFKSKPEKVQAYLTGSSFKNTNVGLLSEIDPALLAASPNFCSFLFWKINLEQVSFINGIAVNNTDSRQRVFDYISNNFDGVIREKLLVLFLLQNKSNEGILEYGYRALLKMKHGMYRKIILDMIDLKAKGKAFFPFELADDKGNLVRLTDFKDKVVLFDFWYTGCLACAKLNKALTPVYERYNDNPNVKFVSICIDRKKEDWLKSIEAGLYTHPNSINLYAGGKGSDSFSSHPLIKAYKIEQFPTLMMIKDGKVYSSELPHNNNGRLLEIIENALGK